MELRGIDFGPIACAVGAMGFYGEGYPFHKTFRYIPGFNWDGFTLAAKTLTLHRRSGKNEEPGNMPLMDDGLTPEETFPKCIWVERWPGGHMLNCVGLANFGIEFYLQRGYYQRLKKPYFISIMDMDPKNAVLEIRQMCQLLVRYLGNQEGSIYAVQINCACPNTGKEASTKPIELIEKLRVAREILGDHIPILANFNALVSLNTLIAIDAFVDAYWIGNTIPAGNEIFSEQVWKRRFNVRRENGEWKSPLTDRGMPMAGGLSGPMCLEVTHGKVLEMYKSLSITKPIVAGNGIRSVDDIEELYDAGASMVFVGSAGVTKPWALNSLQSYREEPWNGRFC